MLIVHNIIRVDDSGYSHSELYPKWDTARNASRRTIARLDSDDKPGSNVWDPFPPHYYPVWSCVLLPTSTRDDVTDDVTSARHTVLVRCPGNDATGSAGLCYWRRLARLRNNIHCGIQNTPTGVIMFETESN